jgi:hypothetical protein
MNLTILIPGIRSNRWDNIYEDLENCVGKYKFELICIGPYLPSVVLNNRKNFRYIKDLGTPSRCLQIGSEFAIGEFICWIPDDCILEKGSLEKALDFMYEKSNIEDGMCLTYSEGIDFTGNQDKDENYWVGYYHDDQRLKQVDPTWKIAPLFMYRTQIFRDLGGLDCSFEHVNLNTHDLAYRVQKNGGTIHLSPSKILSVSWVPGQDVITQAHFENDIPIMNNLYDNDEFPRIKISVDNWKNSSYIWLRRFTN